MWMLSIPHLYSSWFISVTPDQVLEPQGVLPQSPGVTLKDWGELN